MRSELERVKNTLELERQARNSYIAGDIRRYESEYKELVDILETERRGYKRVILNNKIYLANAKKLDSERTVLLEEIATYRSQILLDKTEIKNLRQQVAKNARSMREMKRELRRPLFEADERAKGAEARAEAAEAAALTELQRTVKEVRQNEKEMLRELKRATQEAHAALWRASKKETEVDLKVAKAHAEARRAMERADRIVLLCDRDVEAAQLDVAAAQEEADAARQNAMAEAEAAREANEAKDLAEYQSFLMRRQVERAQLKAAKLKETLKDLQPVTYQRSAEEWAALEDDARRKAAQRERNALRGFFLSHKWRVQDVATVLEEVELLPEIFMSKEGERHLFSRIRELHKKLEADDYGIRFGMFLHFEMRLSLAKIQQIVEAACKEFFPSLDRYKKKPWHCNPYIKKEALYTPRIVPSRSKLEPVIKQLGVELGVTPNEDGLLAFRSFEVVLQELMARDLGKLGMPTLLEFKSGLKLPIVISRDATGKGSLQFTTIAARSPWATKSAQLLHIFGFGCCSDGREGTRRLLGPNLEAINHIIDIEAANQCTTCEVGGERVDLALDLHFTDDVSALRHGEHLANSGWCGCTRDQALRVVPKKPESIAEMKDLVSGKGYCRELSCLEREILSHNPPDGEELPRPCIAPGCKFGHDRAAVAKEYEEMLATESQLEKDKSKEGRKRFTDWRMRHAYRGPASHLNVQPGLYGRPLLRHHMEKQILDALHLAVLGLPKTPWKHGIKNNASDEALEKISEQLRQWKHPLDMRRKEDGRVREQKWFSGDDECIEPSFLSFSYCTYGACLQVRSG